MDEQKHLLRLEKLSFENYREVLNIQVAEHQKGYAETPADTIAMAYAGMMEELPGTLSVICLESKPIGLALIGLSPVGDQEPAVLKKYGQAFRIFGFQIDRNYQGKDLADRPFLF